MAKQYGKRVGFRVQMSNPDIDEPALPDFVLDKVPMVRLRGGEWKRRPSRDNQGYSEPRYDHPFFQDAFRELNALLAAELDGNPLVEYMDTFMYGFWGEGHTWPFTDHPFPDGTTAERTFVRMFDVQLEHWKTPARHQHAARLEPRRQFRDARQDHPESQLAEDRHDLVNQQIEAISNRPPWVAAVLEVGMSDGSPESLRIDEGVTYTDNVIAHVMDVGANYWSLWNWHAEKAENVMNYYRRTRDDRHHRSPGRLPRAALVRLALRGRRSQRARGRLRQRRDRRRARRAHVNVTNDDGSLRVGGGLDPGYPLPGKIRQARFELPPGTDWKGLRLKARDRSERRAYPCAGPVTRRSKRTTP